MEFKNKKLRILLVRHAKDVPLKVGGWSDSHLSEVGVSETKQLAETIKGLSFNFDEIVANDLPRIAETADILKDELGLNVTYVQDLREINNGDLRNLTKEQCKEKFPGLYFFTLKFNEPYPNGESPEQFYNRVISAFEKLVEEYNKKSIILVTSKGVIDIIMTVLYKRKWSNRSMPIIHVGCGECLLIDIVNDDVYINEINEL